MRRPVVLVTSADDIHWTQLGQRWRSVVAQYCATFEDRSLQGFLHYAALANPIDYQPGDDDRVTLMTIHTAKGLERPLVFLAGAEEIPMDGLNSEEQLEEERRVLYVAMTRAQRRLCVSWARTFRGYSRQLTPWLRDLPGELVNRRVVCT